MQWYHQNQHLFRIERKALAEKGPLMMLSIAEPGFHINPVCEINTECAVAHGNYVLKTPTMQEEIEFNIALVLPENYPHLPPVMFCNDTKLPICNIDRHILKNGQACLEVRTEIKRRWPQGSNLVDFLTNLVDPFLAWQVYYDAFGEPPEWGGRSHGIKGILEYYVERIGRPADENVIGFIILLARKNVPKGHELCPCGSGKKLRHCHRQLIRDLRERISWLDVAKDLVAIQDHDATGKIQSQK